MAGNAPEQILINHWTNRINTREPDPEEGLHDYLIKMGDIVEDIPPSYRQYMDLVPFQIDFFIGLLEGELKTFAEWVRQEEHFDVFFYFVERVRYLLDEM